LPERILNGEFLAKENKLDYFENGYSGENESLIEYQKMWF
jgi:hypothetical protein